ncbi:MAG: SDR family NAD(P)-dependent oxidoreductase [SAR324 cluster bacterium]|nr:SDR family NAD(P)-dependent oxidoreductase [SAR324 cluster bacterium]MCZ6645027.1 SDR family NAD(P)-dependent oxidoreductase [SAR324 cluster bacterium]
MSERNLKGKVALVTGGAAGIGRAICIALAELGADIAVMDVNGDGAKETAQLAAGQGVRQIAVNADVSDYEAVKAGLEQVRSALGDPQIMICNAGIAGAPSLFRNENKENWKRQFEVHVDGAYHCIRETINPMLERGWGRIVCTSSVAATLGWRGAASYAAAKGALIALVRTLALEYAAKGVTANAVLPGVIETELMREGIEKVRDQVVGSIPMGRIGEPEDIANAVAFLCSDRAAYLTGQMISPNGGMWIP